MSKLRLIHPSGMELPHLHQVVGVLTTYLGRRTEEVCLLDMHNGKPDLCVVVIDYADQSFDEYFKNIISTCRWQKLPMMVFVRKGRSVSSSFSYLVNGLAALIHSNDWNIIFYEGADDIIKALDAWIRVRKANAEVFEEARLASQQNKGSVLSAA